MLLVKLEKQDRNSVSQGPENFLRVTASHKQDCHMKNANSPPERDIKNNNLHDKLSYCRQIEFADDIAEIHIKIRNTRE
jgi:hypothetical protein